MSHKREPVAYTCPDIDNQIDELRNAAQELSAFDSITDIDEIRTIASQTETTLTAVMEFLDKKLRTANARLRDWGEEEARRVDELESEADDKDRAISKLESQVEGLQGDINEKDNEIYRLNEVVDDLQAEIRSMA